jgi:hypothetical protein
MEFAQQSTAQAGDEPQQQTKSYAEQDAGRQRKVKGGVLAFVDNVARQSAEAERQLAAKIKECSHKGENTRHIEKRPAEFPQ